MRNFCIAVDNNLAFSGGVVIQNLQKIYGSNYRILVFHSKDFLEQNKKALEKLCIGKLILQEYSLDLPDNDFKKRFTDLACARFDAFKILKEPVLYLDTDIWIFDSVDKLFEIKTPIAMVETTRTNRFYVDFNSGVDPNTVEDFPVSNSGVILFNKDLSEEYYKELDRVKNYIYCLDQCVINKVALDYGITYFGHEYNCIEDVSPKETKPIIKHYAGMHKLWTHFESRVTEFIPFYKNWLAAGGEPMPLNLEYPNWLNSYNLKAGNKVKDYWEEGKCEISDIKPCGVCVECFKRKVLYKTAEVNRYNFNMFLDVRTHYPNFVNEMKWLENEFKLKGWM